jgi:hypothetical protein
VTEAEWLNCTNPTPMLEFLRVGGKASDRKLRLFAVACCRQIWDMLPAGLSRVAVEVAERFAEGLASQDELGSAYESVRRILLPAVQAVASVTGYRGGDVEELDSTHSESPPEDEDEDETTPYILSLANVTSRQTAEAVAQDAGNAGRDAAGGTAAGMRAVRARDEARLIGEKRELEKHSGLLRDIFGSPFRPVSIDPAWLTPDVTSLAIAAYEERSLPSGELDAARLAVLADALEDASCTEASLLDHLRSPGPHVRGCFAVDLLLGKE